MELSPYTNRPVIPTAITYPVVFWCQTCQKKLPTATVAMTHLNGRSHKTKVSINKKDTKLNDNKKDPNKRNEKSDISKMKNVSNSINERKQVESSQKQTKEESTKGDADNITCEDCNLVFDNHIVAIQHFKGKKHVAKIAAKVAAKQNQRGRGGGGVRGRIDGWPGSWRGRGVMPGPVGNFYDRRLNMFDRSKDNFHTSPPQPCGPARRGYGGGYFNGFCGNSVPDYRLQYQNHHRNHHDDQFSSDGEPVKSLLDEPRTKATNGYYDDYNNRSNKVPENNRNKKNSKSRGGGSKPTSWLPGQGRGIPRGAYNGYNNSGYSNDKDVNLNKAGYQNSMRGNNAWWDNHFIKGPSMRGIK